ncbi:ATP-dependent RNA helicase TDRD9 [Pholidichthys leucotaenia]
MKKAFTAEQISDWFTSGATFANIKITENAVEQKLDHGPSSKETSPPLEAACLLGYSRLPRPQCTSSSSPSDAPLVQAHFSVIFLARCSSFRCLHKVSDSWRQASLRLATARSCPWCSSTCRMACIRRDFTTSRARIQSDSQRGFAHLAVFLPGTRCLLWRESSCCSPVQQGALRPHVGLRRYLHTIQLCCAERVSIGVRGTKWTTIGAGGVNFFCGLPLSSVRPHLLQRYALAEQSLALERYFVDPQPIRTRMGFPQGRPQYHSVGIFGVFFHAPITVQVRYSCDSAPPPPSTQEYPSFPITKNREELISLIENNSVVIVRGATGSGKTTQLPQYILDYYSEKNASCNIVVTQPRKIGATSIARWVAMQRKCTLGSLVGYQVALEKMATEHTRLIYMTTGVLLQKLVQAKCLTDYSHIFVDEVHERSEEMDFLLLVLRMLLESNSRYVKIILMSATINCGQFAEYFATPIHDGRVIPAYVFEVKGAPYAIEEFYLDDLCNLMPYTVESPLTNYPNISEDMYSLAINLIQSFDELESQDSSKMVKEGVLTASERGSVLVFLPGLHEITYMHEALARLVHKRLQIYPLHSSVTLEEQNGVFLSPVPGYRKVILSTNIAESSVTVRDVKYVIDFCLARHLVCDQDTNYQSLRLTWASKTNCNQRRGRAGRVSKGYCYRLVTKEFWKSEIPDYMIPEMLLAPLATIVLKVKLWNIGDPRSLLSKALTPPNLCDIVKTVLQLKEMGALSSKNDGTCENEDGDLTFLGRVMAHLPVDLYLGKMIVLGHVFGCLDECLIIAASHSLKSFFAMPSMQQFASHRSKMAFAHGVPSDSIAFVNAFKAWDLVKKKGHLRHPKDDLDWGKKNFIQIKRIREVAELYNDLKNRVAQFNMHISEETELSDYTSIHMQKFILQVVIAGAFYPNYFVQAKMDEYLASRELSGFNPRTTVMVWNLPPYSFLYYKQLQSLFRLCGQVKSISFESSRAYVELHSTSQDPGVLPEVSLALLLASQRASMDLMVYPVEQIEKTAGNRLITHLKYSRLNVDVQSQSVSPVEAVGSTFDSSKVPPSRLFVVNITAVVEVGHFWAFQADEASLEKQRHLTAEINTSTLQPVSESLYPNLLCLAPYSETDEPSLYYRAKILHIRGSTVEVFFLDFGNTAVVACSSLRELPSHLLSHPFQAQEFCIAGMQPSAQSVIMGNQWSSRARNRFIILVKGQSLIVSLYSILHGIMRVDLLISSETTNTSILDILVEEGHAVKVEESFDSKQNHEALMSLYNDIEKGTYILNSASSSWEARKKEDKELIDSLISHFSKNSQSYSRTKFHLRGPTTPYRMNFFSLSHKTFFKTVCIEKTSVNSLALNENLHYNHQRMLVAGTVSVDATGTRILLRDTTLMPDIPGLPALVTMLFTPIMELRTDEERTSYTGAICGLGCNSQTQEAFLPEHDIELAFDVKFDVDDITEINALRVAINRLVCEGPNGTVHLEPDRVRSLQEDCRERLIRLFTKSPPREAVTPLYFENIDEWNQVDPSLRMDIVEPCTEKARGVLYQLHPVTVLNS